jgi:hypothetical protein
MGGPSASHVLEQGHLTQTWLAVSGSPDATRSGQVWHHHRPAPIAAARDSSFQDRLLKQMAEVAGIDLEGQYGARRQTV